MTKVDGSAMQSIDGDPNEVRDAAYVVLDEHWVADGYTMPNRATYPWQWLWDSCFHAIAWADFGDDRALTELAQLFGFQTSKGFVPHMNYHPDPAAAVAVWGRSGASTITQPPMYGHAIAELMAAGMTPTDEVLDAAVRGLDFMLRHRRRSTAGLIEVAHPWETGCDDSARWDASLDGVWERERWRSHKHHLVTTVTTDDEGAALHNDEFAVGSVGFSALVAFNALELDRAIGAPELASAAAEVIDAISGRWRRDLRTWVDDGALASTSGRVRTTDAFFALLVDRATDRMEIAAVDLVEASAYGAPFGPAGLHQQEPSHNPRQYWRGPAWPQMSYLLWVALDRFGPPDAAATVARGLRRGMCASGFAEFWHPVTGEGLGAIPQSWATLGALRSIEASAQKAGDEPQSPQ